MGRQLGGGNSAGVGVVAKMGLNRGGGLQPLRTALHTVSVNRIIGE